MPLTFFFLTPPPGAGGGHLGGFGAENMFEAQINKLKEKIEHCAYLQGVLGLRKSL